MRFPRRLTAPALAVAALLVVVAAILAVGSSASGGTAAAATRSVTVKRGVIQSTVSGSGSLSARRDRELAFATAGTVKTVLVAAGDHVAKGQVLARMETTAGVTKRLRAPFAGTIATASIGAGDTVGGASTSSSSAAAAGGSASSSSDTTTAFELVSLKGYDLAVSLSESDIGKVKKGQAATVTVDATGDELAARVARVSLLPASSSSTSTTSSSSSSSGSAVSYSVTLRLTQSSADLKPGMSASADIVTAETTGLTVPTAALRGTSVTVVADGEKTTKQVQTGTAGDSVTQIVSGLKAGDTVSVTSASARAGATSSSSSSSDSTSTQQQGGFGGGPPGGGTGGPPGGGGFGG